MSNTNGTALALRGDAPVSFGSRDELQAIADRIRVMLPSAHLNDYQLRSADRDILQKKLDEAVYRTAQLCVFYRLVPGEDVHVIPFGDSWAVSVGISARTKAAERYCAQHGITYHIHTEDMPLEELKARRGNDYHPDDCGVVAYLWRSDKKDVYDIFGAKQSMSRACGVWAKKAKMVKGEWKPDQLPAQRSKQDVAKRRAMKAVLMLEFSLDALLSTTPADASRNAAALHMRLDAAERNSAIIQRPREEIDEDGFIVTNPRQPIRDVEFVVVEEEEPDVDEAEVDDLWDAQPADADMDASDDAPLFDYAAIAAKLDGPCATFAQRAKQIHLNGDGPATVKQYQYLVGVIDAITGQKESYRGVLGVLVGRDVDSDNRPSFDLCQKLLHYLVKEKTERDRHGARVKAINTAYRQDYADHIVTIWQAVEALA